MTITNYATSSQTVTEPVALQHYYHKETHIVHNLAHTLLKNDLLKKFLNYRYSNDSFHSLTKAMIYISSRALANVPEKCE